MHYVNVNYRFKRLETGRREACGLALMVLPVFLAMPYGAFLTFLGHIPLLVVVPSFTY